MNRCENHTHRRYHLTCEQFSDLRSFSGGLCNICGMREQYTPIGLYIDHDHSLGDWAVRGLLCPRCNTVIEIPGKLVGPELNDYLANPWHRRVGLTGPISGPGGSIRPRVSRRQIGLKPNHAHTSPQFFACEARLDELGERFSELRGPRRGLPPAALQLAKDELYPAIVEARREGLSVRNIARRTGYSPEQVYSIWHYQRAKEAPPAE